MSLIPLNDFDAQLRCPACSHAVVRSHGAFRCENAACPASQTGFPTSGGLPVLVDFDNSVLDRSALVQGDVPRERKRQSSTKRLFRRWFLPSNQRTQANCSLFTRHLLTLSTTPVVLVVGGGAIGEGADPLYEDSAIRTVAFDIYATEDVQLVADGHNMPFADASFDGVWIQAVLEHVLEPGRVVEEITRVLRPGGIVYAETPFLQGVHEAAYDFTRFTDSGHRWLFRDFEWIDSGTVMGPFAHLIDAIGGATRALSGSTRIALATQAALFWLKFFDRLVPERRKLDHASAVWFLGRRATPPIGPRDAIDYYEASRSPRSDA